MKATVNILYISIIGMSEPLGKSQVLEYLKRLSEDYNISLHTFEKNISDEVLTDIQHVMNDHNIDWSYQRYSNTFGVLSTLLQIISSCFYLLGKVWRKPIHVIHARSLIPVMIALPIKFVSRAKIVFDIRGFQTDEKAEVGRLNYDSLLYSSLKRLEKFAYQVSDSVVSLTYDAQGIIGELTDVKKVTVIPTCANSEVFKVCDTNGLKKDYGYDLNDRIILHVGTVGNWYDFDSELILINELMSLDHRIKFLVLNKGEHDLISEKMKEHNVDTARCRVLEVDFYEMYKYLNISEASLFIIKPTYSKRASAPTKFAENLCCELFSITNNDIGDMNYYIEKYPDVGYSFDVVEMKENPRNLANKILTKLDVRNRQSGHYKALYNESMSNVIAVQKYSMIYDQLAK